MKGLHGLGAGVMDVSKLVGGTVFHGGTALLKGSMNLVGNTLKGVTSLVVGGDDKDAMVKRARHEAETLSADDVNLFQDMFKTDDSINSLEVKAMTEIDVTAVLMDLTLYKYPRLVSVAFELLTRMFSQVSSVLQLAAAECVLACCSGTRICGCHFGVELRSDELMELCSNMRRCQHLSVCSSLCVMIPLRCMRRFARMCHTCES